MTSRDENYHEKLAKELGLEILESKLVNKLLDTYTRTWDQVPKAGEGTPDGAFVAVAKEARVRDRVFWMSAIFRVMAVCAKFPGRKTWVIGYEEQDGYSFVHIFAEDSIAETAKRIRRKTEKLVA